MAVSLGEIKKMCKEKGDGFRAASLFGIGKNDSGKCDFFVTTSDAAYAVKVLTLGEDAQRVYFYRDREYFTVKTAAGDEDYMWVRPNFPEAEGGKPCASLVACASAATLCFAVHAASDSAAARQPPASITPFTSVPLAA